MGSRVRALSVAHLRPAKTSNPLPRLFFYEGDGLPPFPALLATLRSSLATTLDVFAPLAGKLAVSPSGDAVVIDCSSGTVSQGVRFVEAEYAGGADDMRRRERRRGVRALPAPALAVQVTRPADYTAGGAGVGVVVVGVSVNHAVADGQALWEFIRAWAAAARGSSLSPAWPAGFVPPTFDRAAINRQPEAEELARKFLRVFAPALPTGRRTYLLSASQITSLKQRIVSLQSKRAGAGTPPAAAVKPPTTYAAVASLVWTSGVSAKNGLSDAGADAYLMFAADCRARLRPPVPGAFFGNCVKACYARATVGELHEGGAGALACAAAAIGSSNRFAAYDTDFGWGRPSRVELASVFVREFVAVVGAPDGAVQVSVVLVRDRIHDFDTNFLSQLQGSV
ncbi:hypothetical protein BS78_10G036100 [Paspalum vaginatum]|nr:hypothetical protein BS78_10G036100 [Paspalum vaginatum]